jgi:hypothetical protein
MRVPHIGNADAVNRSDVPRINLHDLLVRTQQGMRHWVYPPPFTYNTNERADLPVFFEKSKKRRGFALRLYFKLFWVD